MRPSFATLSVLTELTIKVLGLVGKDQHATDQANQFLNVTEKAGYYRKCKLARVDIIRVINARDNARNYRKDVTRPYGEKDLRMLPTSKIIEYDATMGEFKTKFRDAALEVQRNWHDIIAKQRDRLNKTGGSLFNPSDYPNQTQVINFFVFEMGQLPVPQVDHFMLDIESRVLDRLKRDLDRDNERKLERSYSDLLQRLYAPVSKMADICSNDKKVFDSMVENLIVQTEILADLNFTGNVKFISMISEIRNRLTGYTPGQIRDDKRLKQDLGIEAAEIASEIDGMINILPVV